ncbi:MAG: hypothetical protein JKX98_06435 [Alcanivoracaceae bacterium]|nr:hypothetical protein [Alcanivoracaceae bacterium]
MTKTINKQTFENINNKIFEILFDSENPTSCELIEIKGINTQTVKEGLPEPFSLVFQAAGDTIFEQNTYFVKNNEFKKTPLFLVPIGSDEKGVRYEAIFT